MAHHQIIVDTSLRLCHILVNIGRVDILGVNILCVVDVLLIGCDSEALDTAFDVGNLLWLRAICLHFPQLHIATAVCCKPNILSIGTPNRRNRGSLEVGKFLLLARCEVATYNDCDATILLHIIACEGVEECRAIG